MCMHVGRNVDVHAKLFILSSVPDSREYYIFCPLVMIVILSCINSVGINMVLRPIFSFHSLEQAKRCTLVFDATYVGGSCDSGTDCALCLSGSLPTEFYGCLYSVL